MLSPWDVLEMNVPHFHASLGLKSCFLSPVGPKEVKPWDVFCFLFSFMILFSNMKEHLGSVVGGGKKAEWGREVKRKREQPFLTGHGL